MNVESLFVSLILFADNNRITLNTLCPYLLNEEGELDESLLENNPDYQTYEQITKLFEDSVEAGLVDLDKAHNEFEWEDFKQYILDIYTDSPHNLTWSVSSRGEEMINVRVQELDGLSNKVLHQQALMIIESVKGVIGTLKNDFTLRVNGDVDFNFVSV